MAFIPGLQLARQVFHEWRVLLGTVVTLAGPLAARRRAW
jgi:hypothetical protein